MKHTITKTEIDFDSKTRLAADHGKNVNKTLDMMVNPANKRIWFVITDHKAQIFSGPSIDDAIECYNNL